MSPKIYETTKGRRYFVVHGKKVFVKAKMSKKEIEVIYKLLLKNIKPAKRKKTSKRTRSKTSNKNKATAIVNINNAPSQKQRRRQSKKSHAFQSTIDPMYRSSSTSGNPKDSGDKDLVNDAINKFNKEMEENKQKLNEELERIKKQGSQGSQGLQGFMDDRFFIGKPLSENERIAKLKDELEHLYNPGLNPDGRELSI
jgi:hypothetical protein